MARQGDSLARTFDFEDMAEGSGQPTTCGLRLAMPGGRLTGPGKYQVLEHRRRRAQIAARRTLDLLDAIEPSTQTPSRETEEHDAH